AQVHDVFNCHQSKTDEKLNKVNKKLQFNCQRTVPMTGKNVWLFESCARTSELVRKNYSSISEGKRLLRAAFEESSDKSSVKAVGNSDVTGNLSHLDLHMSSAEISKESIHTIINPKPQESSSVDIYETLRTSSENVESPVNVDRSAMAFSHGEVQEVKATLNFMAKQKHENKGAVANGNLSVTFQNGTSIGNTSRISLSHKASVLNQTSSDLKIMKVLNPGNLTKFKIPLCRNKPEYRKLESVCSFQRKTCSPLELLDSTTVSRKHKTGEETFLINAEQQPLPDVSDATSTASMKKKTDEVNSKDFQHDGSENLSDEMSALPEHFSLYPHHFLDGQLESFVPDFCGTECVVKPDFPSHSWNATDHPVALEMNDDSKSRGNLMQHKSQNFPDILEAYEEDVLVIDVIQDDPDLFGTSDEKELALVDSENCPVKASHTSICIKDEKQDIEPKYPVTSENRAAVDDSFRYAYHSFYYNNPKTNDIKTHNSPRRSSPSGGVTENFLEDGQLRELDELLDSSDVDEKVLRNHASLYGRKTCLIWFNKFLVFLIPNSDCKCKDLVNCELLSGLPLHAPGVNVPSEATVMKLQTNDYRFSGKSPLPPLQSSGNFEKWKMEKNAIQILEMIELPRKYCRLYFMTLRGCERAKCWFWHVPEQGDEKICMAILRTYISIKEPGLLKRAVQIFVRYYREVTPGMDFASQVLNDLLISLLENCLLQEVFQILNVTVRINTLPAVDVLLEVFEHVASLNIRDAVPALISTFCKLIDAGMLLEFEHFDCIIKFLHQLQVSSREINTVLNIKSRYVFKELHLEKTWLFDFNLAAAEIQHCKEKSDWTQLGALYVNARTGCEHFDDLQKLSLCIAEILTKDSETDRPRVPFCDFADA
ncbi:TOPZ1 protein, partial [Brachypteracias leptosomus]|nr:TOPZ1 protein [Brachypteracias leptosomus]